MFHAGSNRRTKNDSATTIMATVWQAIRWTSSINFNRLTTLFSLVHLYTCLPMIKVPQHGQLTTLFYSQKNHATMKYLASAHQQEESGKRQNDPRKNVQQFMRIEGKTSIHHVHDVTRKLLHSSLNNIKPKWLRAMLVECKDTKS